MKSTPETLKQVLCSVLLVLACTNVMAEKWEWVHRNFRLDYYVDVDSIKKDGDKATARILSNAVCESPINGDYQKTASIFTYEAEFNCADGSRKLLSSGRIQVRSATRLSD